MKKRIAKIICIVLSVVMLFSACGYKTSTSCVDIDNSTWNTNYKYVFVHGLSGWGSYDNVNKFMKYWGMFGGDLLKELDKAGFDCYSASVNPQGSAWDRACELYAQLTGSVVDYGKEHSERCNHDRFGTDYSNDPLIDEWDSENKINLLGHSFGGATIRMLSELMANGSEAEQSVTDSDDISALFVGGKGDWIYSLTTLAAPHNGTSAYEANANGLNIDDELSFKQRFMSDMVNSQTSTDTDGRADYDYANFDLKIDNAMALNEVLLTQDNLYYFSVPCSSTIIQEDNTYYPNIDITESTFVKSAIKMGRHTGTTQNGFVIDENWLNNDGLVNTISATAPFNAPACDYDENNINKGVWNVFPVFEGDHMSLQGGLFKTRDMFGFYLDLLNTINNLKD